MFVLNNFYKLLLTLNTSPLLTKVGVQLSIRHAYVSSLFMESLQTVQYFLLRLQYKRRQIKINKMERVIFKLLYFVKC